MLWKNLLDNLSLGRKFLLFVALAALLVAAPLGAYLHYSQTQIAATQRAQQGVQPVVLWLQALQALQQFRHLSSAAQAGTTEATPKLPAIRSAVDGALSALSLVLGAQDINAAVGATAQAAQAGWNALPTTVSAAQHNALIGQMQALRERMVDHYGLTRHTEADSAALSVAAAVHLPLLCEALDHTAPEVRLALSDAHQRQSANALDKAMAANSDLNAALSDADSAGRLHFARWAKTPAADTTAALEAQFKRAYAALAALDTLLDTRAKAQRMRQLGVLLLLLLAGMVALLLGSAIARSVSRPLSGAVGMATRFASGDLSKRRNAVQKHEMGRLFLALDDMRAGMAKSVQEIREAADSLDRASSNISHGNNNLSRRTEQQATSLVQTTARMATLTGTVKQNAEHARLASLRATEASGVATEGGTAVLGVVSTMQSIAQSSHKITDIVGAIDSIAFQTNILALNAAVEAARAGEQGRGFAVVASEVRTLAQRSAQSAKAINSLIQASAQQVGGGVQQVENAGKTMEQIVAAVNKVTALIGQIAHASAEQLVGIDQMNRAIGQMEGNTQENAAMVEEAASAARDMADQAQALVATVAKFKLEDTQGPPPTRRSRR